MDSPREIKVVPVQDESTLWEFLRLPWRLYQHDPCWVPPLLSHQRRLLNPRRGPFFETGEARYFLALHQGRPAGRISAHLNRLHDERYGPETGFFGFFECAPDQRVAAALLEAAAAWLRGRGKKRLLGPLSFSIYDEVGLLVEGFDSLPAILHSHNPPYYQGLLEAWGFKKAVDWYAYRMTERNIDIPAMEKRLEDILRRQGLVLTSLKYREMDRRAQEIYQLFNEAWSPNWGHLPLTRRQFLDLFQNLKPLFRPHLVYLLLDNDRLAGFMINVPDLNSLIRKLNGRLSLMGRLRLLYAARFQPLRKVRMLVLGMHPHYQGRRWHYAMLLKTYLYLVKHTPCQVCDISLIAENNLPVLKNLEAFKAQRYKTFRLLEREI